MVHLRILQEHLIQLIILLKKNIEYFETWIDEVDAVIIPEATCSAMIKQDWEHYFHNQPQWKERAVKLSKKNIYGYKMA